MIEKEDKIVKTVTKLIKLTQKGKIEWAVDSFIPPDADYISAFTATYKGHHFRLCKYKDRDKDSTSESNTMFKVSVALPVLRYNATLEINDAYGKSLWKFPRSNAIDDLLEEVEYKVADVDNVINDILSEE